MESVERDYIYDSIGFLLRDTLRFVLTFRFALSGQTWKLIPTNYKYVI